MKEAKLSIVPTPIGNMGDMTFRAVETLQLSDYILAEDTRHSTHLLKHFNINKPLFSYHAHNEHEQVQKIITNIKKNLQHVSLITDAGTPAISDPGYLLVKYAIQENIPVECLPGATAFVPAIVVSGMSIHHFSFYGFLPKKKGRKKILEQIKEDPKTSVLYESPYQLEDLIVELKEVFGASGSICVVKELSKINEKIYRGRISEVEEQLKKDTIKGEYVVVIEK